MAFYGRKPDDSGGCQRARSLTSTHKVLDHEVAGAALRRLDSVDLRISAIVECRAKNPRRKNTWWHGIA